MKYHLFGVRWLGGLTQGHLLDVLGLNHLVRESFVRLVCDLRLFHVAGGCLPVNLLYPIL